MMIRLLNFERLPWQLEEYDIGDCPPYAVFSYSSECSHNPSQCAEPAPKIVVRHRGRDILVGSNIQAAAKAAKTAHCSRLWAFSACVDQDSAVEVEAAVNSAFSIFERSERCLVHLHDLPPSSPTTKESWGACRWWSNIWSLTELIAPPEVEFYDSAWTFLATRDDQSQLVSTITSVDEEILRRNSLKTLKEVPMGVRLSWAANLSARNEEEKAYGLAGLLGESIQVRHGNDPEAFLRLGEQVMSKSCDGSLLAWLQQGGQPCRGLLPRAPAEFANLQGPDSGDLTSWHFDGEITFTNKGIKIKSIFNAAGHFLRLRVGSRSSEPEWIYFVQSRDLYLRCTGVPTQIRTWAAGEIVEIYVPRDVDEQLPESIPSGNQSTAQKGATSSEATRLQTSPDIQASGKLAHRLIQPLDTNDTRPKRVSPPGWAMPGTSTKKVADAIEAGWSFAVGKRSSQWDPYYLEDDDDVSEDELEDLESDDEDAAPKSAITVELLKNPAFQRAVADLEQPTYDSYEDWSRTATYGPPPEPGGSQAPPPKKRRKLAEVHEETVADDSDMVMVTKVDGYFHFACPIYATSARDNPRHAHHACLSHPLRSTLAVKKHLQRHHRRAPYCPTCKSTFSSITDRDAHILAQTCELLVPIGGEEDENAVQGIHDDLLAQLERRDDPMWREAEKWVKIARIVVPDHARRPVVSPYLDGAELRVSMLHDWWAAHGRGIVAGHLGGGRRDGEMEEEGERMMAGLCEYLFREMLRRVVRQLREVHEWNRAQKTAELISGVGNKFSVEEERGAAAARRRGKKGKGKGKEGPSAAAAAASVVDAEGSISLSEG